MNKDHWTWYPSKIVCIFLVVTIRASFISTLTPSPPITSDEREPLELKPYSHPSMGGRNPLLNWGQSLFVSALSPFRQRFIQEQESDLTLVSVELFYWGQGYTDFCTFICHILLTQPSHQILFPELGNASYTYYCLSGDLGLNTVEEGLLLNIRSLPLLRFKSKYLQLESQKVFFQWQTDCDGHRYKNGFVLQTISKNWPPGNPSISSIPAGTWKFRLFTSLDPKVMVKLVEGSDLMRKNLIKHDIDSWNLGEGVKPGKPEKLKPSSYLPSANSFKRIPPKKFKAVLLITAISWLNANIWLTYIGSTEMRYCELNAVLNYRLEFSEIIILPRDFIEVDHLS